MNTIISSIEESEKKVLNSIKKTRKPPFTIDEFGHKIWHVKQHNYKLMQERLKNTVYGAGIPFGIRTKPTNHKQFCTLCHKPFVKNDRQMLLDEGMRLIWTHGIGQSPHIEKAQKERKISINNFNSNSKLIMHPRKVYIHPKCFACAMNYIARVGNAPELETNICNSCDNRFKCFTEESKFGRMKITDEDNIGQLGF
jgi:hypothetical protein